jgi:predicted patatin/cPLA2 family phospholipase
LYETRLPLVTLPAIALYYGPVNKVLEAILERARRGSAPRKRDDGWTIGLAIEGGSMRGVVSAGMVTALEQLELLDCFDIVYGTSAGALNGAYFIARQAAYGTTIYYEDINNEHFLDFRRVMRGSPAVSLEYLLDEVMTTRKILDWQAVLQSPIPLRVIASSIHDRRAKVLEDFKSQSELFLALKASARMPAMTGPPVEFRGDFLVDGSVYEAIPYRSAAPVCSHILALHTRPFGCRVSRGLTERCIVSPWIRRYNPAMCSDVLGQKVRYRKDLDQLAERTEKGDTAPYICSIALPVGAEEVSRTEKRQGTLITGAIAGFKAVCTAFGRDPALVVSTLHGFNKMGRSFSWQE